MKPVGQSKSGSQFLPFIGMTSRRLQAGGNLQEQVPDTARSLQERNEKERKNVLYSISSCAIKEGGLEDLEQRVRDPKETGVDTEGCGGQMAGSEPSAREPCLASPSPTLRFLMS